MAPRRLQGRLAPKRGRRLGPTPTAQLQPTLAQWANRLPAVIQRAERGVETI